MGEAFQALIGPRLRGDKGQFFTPKSLVKCIVSILKPSAKAKIVDPACGTGGFLVEAHAFQSRQRESNITAGQLIGLDKDKDLCRLAEAIVEIIAPDRSAVVNVNSLDFAALSILPGEMSPINADFIMTNPPFGAKIKITDKYILRQFALGYRWSQSKDSWHRTSTLREAQDPQILFIELCIKLLKPGGQMAIILPEGVFGNHSSGYVWDFIRSYGAITALIDCPRTTFQPSTDTKTNVLFFQKTDEKNNLHPQVEQIWTSVALYCGHDRRGRSTKGNGKAYPDDFKAIGDAFDRRLSEGNLWQLSKIVDPYYLVPRYYDNALLNELSQEAERLGAKLISLGEMVRRGYIRIRKGHEVGAEAYGTGDIPFVRTSDIANYEISIDPNRSVSEEIYEQYAPQQKLASGDILMVSDGRYRIGRMAILHEYNYQCVVQSHIRIISTTSKCPIRPIELLYLLSLPMVQHQIRNLIFIQSTLGALGQRINEIRIPLPPRTSEWEQSVHEFHSIIEDRAKLLNKLSSFEHTGYEL